MQSCIIVFYTAVKKESCGQHKPNWRTESLVSFKEGSYGKFLREVK